MKAVVVNVEPEKPRAIAQFHTLTPLKVVDYMKPGNESRAKSTAETLPIGSIVIALSGEYGGCYSILDCQTSKLVPGWMADYLLLMKAHEVKSITLCAREDLPD